MAQFTSPFPQRPLSDWIEDLQHAEAAEDRYRALLAIHSSGDFLESVPWCRSALHDSDAGVRALAAKQIGQWRHAEEPRASDAIWQEVELDLVPLLQDADPDVRFETARSLGRIDPKLTSPGDVLLSLLDGEETQPLMIAVVVSALGERTDLDSDALVPRFRTLLGHSQAEVRENVSSVVSRWDTAALSLMIAELVLATDDDEPIVRENAVLALGKSGLDSSPILAALTRAMEDEDEGVAAAARLVHARLSQR